MRYTWDHTPRDILTRSCVTAGCHVMRVMSLGELPSALAYNNRRWEAELQHGNTGALCASVTGSTTFEVTRLAVCCHPQLGHHLSDMPSYAAAVFVRETV